MADTHLRIRNGRVIDPANGIDARQDLFVANGVIAAVGAPPPGFRADREIDAAGRVVCAGLVDLCARLREPGQEHKASIDSETHAAVSGGITTLCCPPDTQPITDTPAVAKLIRERAAQLDRARVLPMGALTRGLDGALLSEMAALKEAGCIGVSNALRPVTNNMVMRRAMEYAATQDLTLFLHAEDPALKDGGSVHEGAVSTRLGLRGIPEAAETVAVASHLALIEQTGVRGHFSHISAARAVRMIGRAQHDGLSVSADVTAHHLHLTELDIGYFNAQCHVQPPLRTQRDRDGLCAGVAQGIVTAICSDHQPHDADAKQAPFCATEPGISGLETLLPLSLRLAENGAMTLSDVLARLTCGPAAILGIEAGTLSIGAPADICIFDPQRSWRVTEQNLLSRGHNTPFLGWELKGRVTHTIYAGKVVYELPGL